MGGSGDPVFASFIVPLTLAESSLSLTPWPLSPRFSYASSSSKKNVSQAPFRHQLQSVCVVVSPDAQVIGHQQQKHPMSAACSHAYDPGLSREQSMSTTVASWAHPDDLSRQQQLKCAADHGIVIQCTLTFRIRICSEWTYGLMRWRQVYPELASRA